MQALHVSPQNTRQSEHLAAERALVRLDARVDPTVPRQEGRPREPLPANGAFERLLTGVHLEVVLEDA